MDIHIHLLSKPNLSELHQSCYKSVSDAFWQTDAYTKAYVATRNTSKHPYKTPKELTVPQTQCQLSRSM